MSKQVENILENLPSNEQITKGLEKVKKELQAAKTVPGVDSTGQKILGDTEKVITDTERLIMEKNEGEKVQELLREGQKAAAELQRQADMLKSAGVSTSVDTERLRELAERTFETARLAGIELMTSHDFRRSLMDFVALVGDLISEGGLIQERPAGRKGRKARRAARKKQQEGAKPAEGETAAPSTTFPTPTTEAGPSMEPSVTPLTSTAEPITTTATSPPTPTLTTGEGAATGEQPPTIKEDVKEKAKEGIEKAVNVGLQAVGVKKRVQLNPEQVDMLYDRFVTIIREVTQRERSKKVFLGLLDMFRLVGQELKPVAEEVTGKIQKSAEEVQYNRHVKRTMRLAKELIEQFIGDNTLDSVLAHIKHIRKLIKRDPEVRQYFDDLSDYVVDIMHDINLLDDPATRDRGRDLVNRGRSLQQEKVYTHIRGVVDDLQHIVKRVQKDPVTKNLRNDMKKLIKDIMLDKEGHVILKEHELQQLRVIIVSSVIERMKIPVPVIHIEDEDMEYTLRNLVVSIRDLVPDRVVLETRGRVALDFSDVRSPEVEQVTNIIRIVIQGVNVHMEQADISFHRKTFPRITDAGTLRLDIGGKGLDLVIQLQTFARTKQIFRVEFVDCDVHDMSFYLQDTRHDFLYNAVLKLLGGRIKRNIETNIENTLTNHLEQLNRLLTKQLRKAKALKGDTSLTSAIKSGVSTVISQAGELLPS